jgi:hypothetical protein
VDPTSSTLHWTAGSFECYAILSYSILGALSCQTSIEDRAAMNLRKIYSQSCAWTADHSNLCEEESARGVNPIGESLMPLSVSKKQSTHSVEYRSERGRTMTENDGRGPRVECLRFVCRGQGRNPCIQQAWNECTKRGTSQSGDRE